MTEIWKNIGGEGLYQVSNMGRVKVLKKAIKNKHGGYSIRKERVINCTVSHNGYLRTILLKGGKPKSWPVHKLIAIAFVDNPYNKPFINHIDGNKKNNIPENLEWCTCSENHIHAFKIGLKNQIGEKNNASKLTDSEVVEIKTLLKTGGISKSKIARMFNVCCATIINISKGRVWSHVILKTA